PTWTMPPDDLVRQAQGENMALMARQIVDGDLAIESLQLPRNPGHEPLILRGTLQQPSHEVFPRWLVDFNRRGYTPILRPDGDAGGAGAAGDEVELQVMSGAVLRTPSSVWINLILFFITVISTLFVGTLYGDLDIDPAIPADQVLWYILT